MFCAQGVTIPVDPDFSFVVDTLVNSGTATRVPVAVSAEARLTTRGSSGPSWVMSSTNTTVRRAPVPVS